MRSTFMLNFSKLPLPFLPKFEFLNACEAGFPSTGEKSPRKNIQGRIWTCNWNDHFPSDPEHNAEDTGSERKAWCLASTLGCLCNATLFHLIPSRLHSNPVAHNISKITSLSATSGIPVHTYQDGQSPKHSPKAGPGGLSACSSTFHSSACPMLCHI